MSARRTYPNLSIPDYRRRTEQYFLDITPIEIGSYSITDNNVFANDRSELRYYVGPVGQALAAESNATNSEPLYDGPVNCDIRAGFDASIIHEDFKEGLEDILKWILQNREKIDFADFICRRGLLIKVLLSPYHFCRGWTVAVVRFGGKIYMCEIESEEEATRKADDWTERDREKAFWGFKFEQYVTSASADGTPDTSVPVNCNKAFYSVVKASLKQNNLLFSGEVDCQDINQEQSYMTLKTRGELKAGKDTYLFKRYKLMKTWAQSYLIGAGRVVYGFRTADGIVKRIQTFQTSDIPQYCSDEANWNQNDALDFCSRFLDYVKTIIHLDYDRAVYVFEKRPKETTITCHMIDRDPNTSKYAFLPDWYIDAV